MPSNFIIGHTVQSGSKLVKVLKKYNQNFLTTLDESFSTSTTSSDELNKPRKHKRKRQQQEQSQYWSSPPTTSSTLESTNEKKIGIVEPRVVIKQPQAGASASTEGRTPSKDLINPGQQQNTTIGPGTCTDFKNNSSQFHFPALNPGTESCSESSSESSEDEMEPIKVAKRRKKLKSRNKSSKKNRLSLRRKAEALLRLAAKADKGATVDENCYSTNNPQTTVTNFRLVYLHFIRYLEYYT